MGLVCLIGVKNLKSHSLMLPRSKAIFSTKQKVTTTFYPQVSITQARPRLLLVPLRMKNRNGMMF